MAVGRYGSIRRAAEELHVSASAIDRQILRAEANANKTPYLSGETTAAAEAAQSGVFTLALNLSAGSYELRVSQVDAGGSGPELNVDTRTFNVR